MEEREQSILSGRIELLAVIDESHRRSSKLGTPTRVCWEEYPAYVL